MHFKKLLSLPALLLGLSPSSCVGSAQPAPTPPVVHDAAHNPTCASREAGREVELLTKLLAIDRRAVEISEQRFANAKDLANAGRLGESELLSAELELLKLRQQLLMREQQLSDAQDHRAP